MPLGRYSFQLLEVSLTKTELMVTGPSAQVVSMVVLDESVDGVVVQGRYSADRVFEGD